jgi:hypothetical protein
MPGGASRVPVLLPRAGTSAVPLPRAVTCPVPLRCRCGVPDRRRRRSWTRPAPLSWSTGGTRTPAGVLAAAVLVPAGRRTPQRGFWRRPGPGTPCRLPASSAGRQTGNRPGPVVAGWPGWSGASGGWRRRSEDHDPSLDRHADVPAPPAGRLHSHRHLPVRELPVRVLLGRGATWFGHGVGPMSFGASGDQRREVVLAARADPREHAGRSSPPQPHRRRTSCAGRQREGVPDTHSRSHGQPRGDRDHQLGGFQLRAVSMPEARGRAPACRAATTGRAELSAFDRPSSRSWAVDTGLLLD